MKHLFITAIATLFSVSALAQTVENNRMLVHQKDGTVTTFAIADIDSITFDVANTDTTAAKDITFDIAIDDITWGDANVTITPSDPTAKYYYYTMPMWKVNSLDGGIDGIIDFDYAFWQMQANMYGCTLNEVIQEMLVSGTKSFRTSDDSGMFKWGNTAVVYCYAIDSLGNVLTPLCSKSFTTTMPNTSSNEFSVKVNKILPNGVEASITPTNNDQYFIAVQRTKFTDYYVNDLDTMAYMLLSSNYKNADAFATGSHDIAADDFYLYANQDYNIIVFGYDNGRSTPVTMVPFHTVRGASSANMGFESYFCDDNANINLTKVSDGTYKYEVADGTAPCTIFNDITAVVAEASESYTYTYDSGDGTFTMTITGSTTADADGVYATMTVSSTYHSEVTKILFVKKAATE